MKNGQRTRLMGVEGHIRENGTHGMRCDALLVAQTSHPVFVDLPIVGLDNRVILVLTLVRCFLEMGQACDRAVSQMRKGDADTVFGEIAASTTAAGADSNQVDRAMTDVVVTVADEVLRSELPIAGDAPFLYATNDH